MDFSELQQSWQQQAAPPLATRNRAASPAPLLSEIERLHRLGRRKNLLATALFALSLLAFLLPQLLPDDTPRVPIEHGGLILLTLDMVAFVAALWRGTSLARAISPSLDSRAYVQASLRAFRFRAWLLTWLAVPYALLLGLGVALLNWHRWHHPPGVDKGAMLTGVLIFFSAALCGRYFGLRRYHQLFGPTVRALEQWEQAWQEPEPGPQDPGRVRPRTPVYLLALGLLLLSGSLLLRHLLPVPDWASGVLLGTGVGCEVAAVYGLTRRRTPRT